MEQLITLLKDATLEDRKAIAGILEAEDATSEEISEAFCYQSQSIFGYIGGSEPSYKEIVQQAAENLEISFRKYETAQEVEIKIAQKVMETVWEKMTPEQKKEMEEELKKAGQKFDKEGDFGQCASMFGALMASRLSGFGVYLLATTTLGFLTSAIGLTLPFVVYTTMTSAIAIVLGPVGWIGAGLYSVWKLTGANYKKLIPAILFVCALRSRLKGGYS